MRRSIFSLLRRVASPVARIALGLAVASCLAACGRSATPSPRLTVFAAASLTDVLPEVAAAWKEEGGVEIAFSFGSTSKLVPQILEGAPADVLVSADEAWMDRLAAGGKADAGSRVVLVRNELVFVVPKGTARPPSSPGGLPGPFGKIALAGEHVPAGRYAKAALEHAGVWAAVAPRVVRADDVRMTLRWVSAGETDGGVVYRTDALADPKVVVAFVFAADTHPPITYPGAVVVGSPRAADAARFLAFCRGERAQALFARRGFAPAAR